MGGGSLDTYNQVISEIQRDPKTNNTAEYRVDDFNFLPSVQVRFIDNSKNDTNFKKIIDLDILKGPLPKSIEDFRRPNDY